MKNRLAASVRAAIAVGLLVAILYSVDVPAIVQKLGSVRIDWVLVVICTAVLDRIVMAYKWNLLLKARGISLPLWQAVRLYYVGHVVGALTPAAVAGDAYRVTALLGFQKSGIIASTIVFERVVGLGVVCMFALVALPFSARYLGVATYIWAVAAGCLFGLVVIIVSLQPSILKRFFPIVQSVTGGRIAQKLKDFYRAYAENAKCRSTLVSFTFLTVFELILIIFIIFGATKAIGIDISFLYFLCVMPVMQILLRLPITIQGIGVQEGLLAYFLVVQGFTISDGVSVSILLRGIEVLATFFPATVMMFVFPLRVDPPPSNT